MDDLMSKIQSVLNDKESMEQLNQLAQMFSQPQGAQGQAAQQTAPPPVQNNVPDIAPLLAGLSQQSVQGGQQQAQPSFDMNKLIALQSVMARASQPDKNRDFLIALRPLLKEGSQRKVDKLISLFKIMAVLPALKESGLLGGDLLGVL